MLEQLKNVERRYEDIGREMALPEVAAHEREDLLKEKKAFESVVMGFCGT